MPKPARKTQQIRKIKKEILDSALKIINQEGIDNFSMRKLAEKADMSPANLYNYYSSKENIIIELDNNGFKILYHKVKNAVKSASTPIDKIKALVREYIEFGTHPERVHQYNIMFNNARVSDYVGTGFEALVEYQTRKAFRILDISYKVISEYINVNPIIYKKDPKLLTLRIWIELHGLVSFFNNRLFNELYYSEDFNQYAQDTRKTVKKLTDHLIDSIINGGL
ncbi:MAG: TetR/AcrR family transcriptional regulator [Promethearchaeota archaeon]|nr:MAG: TetR/AcrR family transcriptional regulator [Candidatus Lokiarchaeota archaeon]